jgi:DNA mismatch repair protein MutS2
LINLVSSYPHCSMMDDRSLNALDFYHLLDLLKNFSVSPLGRKRCEALRPSSDLPFIQSRLTEVLELREIIETAGPPPISGLKDIEGILKRLDVEESVLTLPELMDLYDQIVLYGSVKRFFDNLEKMDAPLLQERVSGLSSLRSLEKEILRTVTPKGEILDTASSSLSEIREQLRKTREKAKAVLEHLLHREDLHSVFQEEFVTLRNGRYVVLIKSDHEHRLQGIVHDQSQSRMTFFFEPLQVVSYNNEISILTGEEKEEEYRILADLSKSVRAEIGGLRINFEILGELDFLYAMAKFSSLLKGVRPLLTEDGGIEMREARHPLLVMQKKEEVVPILLRMGDGIRVLIVSGANAGGKTVAMKTLGLLTLMVQCGLPIPVAEGSKAAIFEDVCAMIGDEQNIEDNLSTFSSHLLHLNQILEKAGPRSLVLLDELGVGTHASEGCALAMALLDQLRERGSAVVVTTHFDRLKVYGYLHPGVENVAVEFDEKTLVPKYTLAYGSSGVSNAFLIAEKLSFSEEVLRKAREYQTGGEQEVMRALEELEKLKVAARRNHQELLVLKEEARSERQRLRELLDAMKQRRNEIFAQAEEKARKTAQKFEEELKEWIRRQKEERKASSSPLRLSGHRREIQEMREKFFPPLRRRGSSAVPAAVQVGDRVRIAGLRREGILVKVEEPLKRAEVMIEGRRVKTSLSDIVKLSEEEEKEGGDISTRLISTQKYTEEVPSELNIIGLTVDEALPAVDKFIDQALVHGLEKVRIIHGIGSGRLRSAVGKYLREHQRVKSHALGDPMKGGGGVTLVVLS